MRILRSFGLVCLAWLWLPGMAYADCDQLLSVIDLAQDTFSVETGPDQNRLTEINKLIRSINNDDMLAILRQSGQAHSFGSVRHFLTVLMFIADRPQEELNRPVTFDQDLAKTATVLHEACRGQTDLNAATTPDHSRPASIRPGQTARWRRLPRWVADIEAEIAEHRNQLRLLGVAMLGLVLAVLFAIAVHIALKVFRIVHRGRSICDVPMHAHVLGRRIDGRITNISRRGCTIVPAMLAESDDELDGGDTALIARGTYFNIKVGDFTLNARTLTEGNDFYQVIFSTPLSQKKRREVLHNSLRPARYDLSSLHWYNIRRRSFGIGS